MYFRLLSREMTQLEFTPSLTLEILGIDLRGSRGLWLGKVSLRMPHHGPVHSHILPDLGGREKPCLLPTPPPGILPPLTSICPLDRSMGYWKLGSDHAESGACFTSY